MHKTKEKYGERCQVLEIHITRAVKFVEVHWYTNTITNNQSDDD